MRLRRFTVVLAALAVMAAAAGGRAASQGGAAAGAAVLLPSANLAPSGAGADTRVLRLDSLFYETAQGRVMLPASLTNVRGTAPITALGIFNQRMPDGRTITLRVVPERDAFGIELRAQPVNDIIRWGFAVEATPNEAYTGIMERVVDGPQQASWAPGITQGLDLRGQKIDLLVKPTLAVYAPFYLSSRGYALYARGTWPGTLDFAATDPSRVRVELEGPSVTVKIYTAGSPMALVRAHAMEAGPPVLPPKWMYRPWRWRDEHTQRAAYYDGTAVTGPFNSEVMEDAMMMKAFGIPNGVYWIDRPWGPGPIGYDDFEIDAARLPNFANMVRWFDANQTKTFLWIGPFVNGTMADEAIARGWGLPGQAPPRGGGRGGATNYPLIDFTNPVAKRFWQDGVAKLLKLGVAGFKLDRSEENIPETGPEKIADGRSIRENRNAYPALYVQATAEVARQYRNDDFVVMPRAAYDGSGKYAAFWGGDIAGTQEGLRASIIAVQRAAVMGYPNWGSDTCGYTQQMMETEVCARWLAFSAFTPIMEVGPTNNVGFWDFHRPASYDETLIAAWRLYARLHDRLADYSYAQAQDAHKTGTPIVRPVALVDPTSAAARANWWTYLYGPDLVVSPIWQKGQHTQQIYLPAGSTWRDAWRPTQTHEGGQTITVDADVHQLPLFIRVGASLPIGDLTQQWTESLAAARTKPDLKTLETGINTWFRTNGAKRTAP